MCVRLQILCVWQSERSKSMPINIWNIAPRRCGSPGSRFVYPGCISEAEVDQPQHRDPLCRSLRGRRSPRLFGSVVSCGSPGLTTQWPNISRVPAIQKPMRLARRAAPDRFTRVRRFNAVRSPPGSAARVSERQKPCWQKPCWQIHASDINQ